MKGKWTSLGLVRAVLRMLPLAMRGAGRSATPSCDAGACDVGGG